MRDIWSEKRRRLRWRTLWVTMVETLASIGAATQAEVDDLRSHIDFYALREASLGNHLSDSEIIAEAQLFADQSPVGARALKMITCLHDIEENSMILCQSEALDLLISFVASFLGLIADSIDAWAETRVVAISSLQPAEPTTVGYRFACFGQDLLIDLGQLRHLHATMRAKGIKGESGTAAEYVQLLKPYEVTPQAFEHAIMERLNLRVFPICTQTAPRKQDGAIASILGALSSSLTKFALDVRYLQSTLFAEWTSLDRGVQRGTFISPHRQNVANLDKIINLGRTVSHLVGLVWDNTTNRVLESNQSDSAIRQEVFSLMFVALDEMLIMAQRLIHNMHIDLPVVQNHLDRYSAFATLERLLLALTQAGADQEMMRQKLRQYAIYAWNTIVDDAPNPLIEEVSADDTVRQYLSGEQVRALLNYQDYVGDAPERAKAMAQHIREALK